MQKALIIKETSIEELNKLLEDGWEILNDKVVSSDGSGAWLVVVEKYESEDALKHNVHGVRYLQAAFIKEAYERWGKEKFEELDKKYDFMKMVEGGYDYMKLLMPRNMVMEVQLDLMKMAGEKFENTWSDEEEDEGGDEVRLTKMKKEQQEECEQGKDEWVTELDKEAFDVIIRLYDKTLKELKDR